VLRIAFTAIASLLLLVEARLVAAATVQLAVPALTIPAANCGNLVISTPTNLTPLHAPGYSFRVRYNPTHMSFRGVAAIGIATGFSISATVDSVEGRIAVLCYSVLNELQGSGDLCRLTFCTQDPSPVSNCKYLTCLDNAWVGDGNLVTVSYGCPMQPCTSPTDAQSDLGVEDLWAAPNPFVAETRIFASQDTRRVARGLEIFDVAGRRVRGVSAAEMATSGNSLYVWDGRDARGHRVPSGLYWVRVRGIATERTIKLIRGR